MSECVDDDATDVLQEAGDDNGQLVDGPPEAAEVAKRLLEAVGRLRAEKGTVKQLRSMLVAMCGPNQGIKGPWGRFMYAGVTGTPLWRSIAEELAGGTVPEDVVERNRGESYRKPAFYPSKALKDSLPGDGSK